MKYKNSSVLKDLVLIGGGHSHVAVLKKFGMRPLEGTRITVLARDIQTPYSGMLPGHVAGHYSYEESHIDLWPLCLFSGARLYHDEATGIDLHNKRVICKSRPSVSFDLVSINIGSRPEIKGIKGAEEFTTPVKPINRFVNRWNLLLDRVLSNTSNFHVAVVGAGAGGVELLLAIQFRLKKDLFDRGRDAKKLKFSLISRSKRILPTFPSSVSDRFLKILHRRGVEVVTGSYATKVNQNELILSNGLKLEPNETLWATGASAPNWIKESGLNVDDRGFLQVSDNLQSTSHPFVFGAGDIAAVENYPRPKSGVYAVRQGIPLANNLRRSLLGFNPRKFRPQLTHLALISSGDQNAIAVRGGLSLEGKSLWKLKNWIDKRWVKKYSQFPEMRQKVNNQFDHRLADKEAIKEISAIAMRCGGCGSKVGASVLNQALAELKPIHRDEIMIGLSQPDDAAVVDVGTQNLMVHSVDYFRSFLDDPFIFGQIAANHSLSDLFAMGAQPQSALAIVTVPFEIEKKLKKTIKDLMSGAILVLNDAKAELVGGHTSEGEELSMGFSVNGIVTKNQLLRKGGMKSGDVLILTKALGTGTIFAAKMQRKARGKWIEEAIQSMVQSNRLAGEIIFRNGASACTDVTGFGLLGHLVEMVKSSNVDVNINLESLPVLEGAIDTLAMGIHSSLQSANVRLRRAIRNLEDCSGNLLYPLIYDPQTSGGLLASVPEKKAHKCLKELKHSGFTKATIIGKVMCKGDHLEPITLS